MDLRWQSKLVLLAVLPFVGVELVLDGIWWAANKPDVLLWAAGLSALLGLVTWKIQAATPAGAAIGMLITASLMFSTAVAPYQPWRTALVPTLAVALLAAAATRAGRRKKQRLGIAEPPGGRSATQVAANLGLAALAVCSPVQAWLMDLRWLPQRALTQNFLFALAVAALAEAAADTASSEIGQALGKRPRLITTLKAVEPGRDGAISLPGSAAGVLAAAIVAAAGMGALGGGWVMFGVSLAGAVFGLFFDSLLGALLEERGWLNNDAVNFLSTASAAAVALAVLCLVR